MKDKIKKELAVLLKGLGFLLVFSPVIAVTVFVIARYPKVGIISGFAILVLLLAYSIGKLVNIHFKIHE